MSERSGSWVVVVEPARSPVPDEALAAWKERHGRAEITDEHILVELIRGADGSALRRYRVWVPSGR